MMFKGCSWVDCSFIGIEHDETRPSHDSNGNVIWPKGWTEDERKNWRMMMDIPGVEWPLTTTKGLPDDEG